MSIIAEVSAVYETASLVKKIKRLSSELKYFTEERLDVLQVMDCWKDNLEDLQKYATDAEKKQSDDELVWIWLKDVESMCLDIEDVITDLQHEYMRHEASSNIFTMFCQGFETINARFQKMISRACKLGLTSCRPSEQGSASKASDLRNSGALELEPEPLAAKRRRYQ